MGKRNEKNRIEYIDILKGLGIMAMVLCHVGTNGHLRHFIYGFHMPLFFYVSGMFYKKKDESFANSVSRKVKVLLIPYLFFCIIQYIAWTIFENRKFELSPFMGCFWMNTDSSLLFAKACWFLTAMFFVQITYDFIRRYINSELCVDLCVILIGAGG